MDVGGQTLHTLPLQKEEIPPLWPPAQEGLWPGGQRGVRGDF